jgi:hypothetical protein
MTENQPSVVDLNDINLTSEPEVQVTAEASCDAGQDTQSQVQEVDNSGQDSQRAGETVPAIPKIVELVKEIVYTIPCFCK